MGYNERMDTPNLLLGQSGVSFSKIRDTDCLYAIPRHLDRQAIGWKDTVPFAGYDLWNHYEFSFMNKNNIPFQGFLQLRYSSDSTNLVESKSLKLYLNSLSMFVGTLSEITSLIETDLEKLLGGTIDISIISINEAKHSYGFHRDKPYALLEDSIQEVKPFECFTPQKTKELSTQKIYQSELLQSCCKVTKQPDWGSIWIRLKGTRQPKSVELLAYILSFRNQFHFHEEVAERIMADLLHEFGPEELEVRLNYTRRGGIDINPVRIFPRSVIVDLSKWIATDTWQRHIRQ